MAKLNSYKRPYGPPHILSGLLRKSPREQADEQYLRSRCIFGISNFETTGSYTHAEAQRVTNKPSITGCLHDDTIRTVGLFPWRANKCHLLARGPNYALEGERDHRQELESHRPNLYACWGQFPGLQFVGYLVLCKSLNLSGSQFPHLFKQNYNTFLVEFLGDWIKWD